MEGRVAQWVAESVPRLTFDQVLDRLNHLTRPYHKNYLAMYSSWLGGIVTDPALMMIPMDDHLVHRGDGIFEAFKCVDSRVYGLSRHLDRLERSAKALSLDVPVNRSRLEQIILETIRVAGVRDCLIRLFVSRGPGGFSTNPYECPASQLYVMVTVLHETHQDKYNLGVHVKTSFIPMKRDYFANIKSCNYLPNVLMTKEAQDEGVDFTISLDERGFLGEGATENVGCITDTLEFVVPRFDRILRGITVSRMLELAGVLVEMGILKGVRESDVSPEEVRRAKEMMMFGTTFDVLPVVSFDGHPIGDGRPGPFFRKLLGLLREDMRSGSEMVTPLDE
ncbi:MAG: peptidase [Deltaproteobacteria bacterium]|nr:peptidase [Deltaproteobacteria bacterium]